MIRIIIAGALAVVPVSSAMADPLRVTIGRVGQVVAQEAGPPEPPRPGNVVGSTPVLAPTFTHLGSDIAGVFCGQFGLEFRAANLPTGVVQPVTVTLQHPLWTLPDGRTSTQEVNSSFVSPDRWTYSGYTLEESWALVPGTWSFIVSDGTRVLGSASFNVTVNPGQTPPKDGCTALTS